MALNEKDSEVKKKPHEMSNAELVSKLMGATPSYFFHSPPTTGHNFFFSELLRSLVQKRKAEELNAAMKAKTLSKKVRKPTYHQNHQFHQKSSAGLNEHECKKPKLHDDRCVDNDNDINQENSQDSVINVDKDDPPPTNITPIVPASTTSTLTQSAFYPYVDPLHFFIDLRVSAGQIYDRKKEAYLQQALKNNNILLDSNTWNSSNNGNPIIGRNRANSAFKVPGSQIDHLQNFNAINLVSNQQQIADTSIKAFSKIYKSSRSDEDDINERNNDDDVQIFDLDKSVDKRCE